MLSASFTGLIVALANIFFNFNPIIANLLDINH